MEKELKETTRKIIGGKMKGSTCKKWSSQKIGLYEKKRRQ